MDSNRRHRKSGPQTQRPDMANRHPDPMYGLQDFEEIGSRSHDNHVTSPCEASQMSDGYTDAREMVVPAREHCETRDEQWTTVSRKDKRITNDAPANEEARRQEAIDFLKGKTNKRPAFVKDVTNQRSSKGTTAQPAMEQPPAPREGKLLGRLKNIIRNLSLGEENILFREDQTATELLVMIEEAAIAASSSINSLKNENEALKCQVADLQQQRKDITLTENHRVGTEEESRDPAENVHRNMKKPKKSYANVATPRALSTTKAIPREKAMLMISQEARKKRHEDHIRQSKEVGTTVVTGIIRRPHSELRAALRGMGVATHKILEISYIGKSAAEIFVWKDYKEELDQILTGAALRIQEEYDPFKPSPYEKSKKNPEELYRKRTEYLLAKGKVGAMRVFLKNRLSFIEEDVEVVMN